MIQAKSPPDNARLSAALSYAAQGYSVFPCAAGQKHPATEHGFKDATTDADQIRRWWTDNPNANIGLSTEGLVVVDIDGADNPWPGGPGLDTCPISVTPSGGRHLVFRQPDGRHWRNTTSKLAPMVDTRADGGYIVVAPSVVGECAYRWTRPLCRREELPEPPQWLIEQVDALKKKKVSTPPTNGSHAAGSLPRYVRVALEGELLKVAMAVEGTRNATLNDAAFALGQFVGACALDRAYAEERLAEAAARCGLDAREIGSTIRSGMNAGIAQPRQATGNGTGHRRQQRAGPSAQAPQASSTGYDIIIRYFREKYQPTFRRGWNVYSSALVREVRRADALAGAGKELIERLANACDAPRGDGGDVKRSALPYFFRTWGPSAWVDLLHGLPDEENSAEIIDPAREDFRRKVAAAMFALVALSYQHRREGGGVAAGEVERRSLADWARMFAKPGRWESVRGYRLWSRLDAADQRLRIALRVELFAQLPGGSDLAKLGQSKFTKLAVLYDVGIPVRVSGGASRAVELDPGFLADLYAEPVTETPTEADGQTDT